MLTRKKTTGRAQRMSEQNGSAQQSIKSLTLERNALRRQLIELRRENRLLRQSLGKLMFGETKINKREMLREFRRGPSFAELIAKLG